MTAQIYISKCECLGFEEPDSSLWGLCTLLSRSKYRPFRFRLGRVRADPSRNRIDLVLFDTGQRVPILTDFLEVDLAKTQASRPSQSWTRSDSVKMP